MSVSEGAGAAKLADKAERAAMAIERLSKPDAVMEPRVFDDVKVRWHAARGIPAAQRKPRAGA